MVVDIFTMGCVIRRTCGPAHSGFQAGGLIGNPIAYTGLTQLRWVEAAIEEAPFL